MERRSILNVGAGLRTAISTTCLCLFRGKPIALRSPTSRESSNDHRRPEAGSHVLRLYSPSLLDDLGGFP